MARARMITNQICRDRAIHNLSDDLSRLAFTWLITFSDCEGRVFGDPAIIRATLFPRRDNISIEQITVYITEWANADLIVWYECEGDQWICFPKFDKNQPGLRKDREPESDIPVYSADTCRILAGRMPEECPVKRREEKLIKENGSEERPAVFSVYEHEIGILTPMISDELMDAEKEYPPEWIPLALHEAAANNKRSWAYAHAILKRWKIEGVSTNHKAKPGEMGGIKFDNVGHGDDK